MRLCKQTKVAQDQLQHKRSKAALQEIRSEARIIAETKHSVQKTNVLISFQPDSSALTEPAPDTRWEECWITNL